MSLAANVCLLLSEWISFLLVAVPPRSRRTFVELLIGCMLNPEGWVTRAIGAIRREAHWTTYYKLIERAQLPVTELSLRLLQLILLVCPAELVTLILDDTLVPRCVKFGPGISIKHDHSHKANQTGQHYDKAMSGGFFEQLGIPEPEINLEVGSGTQAEQTAAIMVRYEKVLLEQRSDFHEQQL